MEAKHEKGGYKSSFCRESVFVRQVLRRDAPESETLVAGEWKLRYYTEFDCNEAGTPRPLTVSIPAMSTAVRGGISPLGRVPPGRLRPGLLAPSLQLAFNVTAYFYPRELGETHLGDEFQQFSAQLDPF